VLGSERNWVWSEQIGANSVRALDLFNRDTPP
jgi:hypothetical protein